MNSATKGGVAAGMVRATPVAAPSATGADYFGSGRLRLRHPRLSPTSSEVGW